MKLFLVFLTVVVVGIGFGEYHSTRLTNARAAGYQAGVESQSGAYDAGFRAGRSAAYRDLLNSLTNRNR